MDHVEGESRAARPARGLELHHLSAGFGQGHQRIPVQGPVQERRRVPARVLVEDPGHILYQEAAGASQRFGQRHRGEVRASPGQRDQFALGPPGLEATHHGYDPGPQKGPEGGRIHLQGSEIDLKGVRMLRILRMLRIHRSSAQGLVRLLNPESRLVAP